MGCGLQFERDDAGSCLVGHMQEAHQRGGREAGSEPPNQCSPMGAKDAAEKFLLPCEKYKTKQVK